MRLRFTVLAVAAFFVLPGNASAAVFFFFDRTTAQAGDKVTVRTAGTPESFTLSQRLKPFRRAYRLYLVPNEVGDQVHSRFDQRLQFIGSLVPDRRWRGVLTFTVPPLDADQYAVAFWCPQCAPYSAGRTFFVLRVDENVVPQYRPLMLLRVAAPSPTEACPVTIPNGSAPPGFKPSPIFHGNGALWTILPRDGVYTRPGAKLIWEVADVDGSFSVRYRRLDALEPALTADVERLTWLGFRGTASWASRMSFSEGCWLITGRVRDISLSFVMRVDLP